MRVLVADDDKDLSTLLTTLLRGAGHQPMAAFDAAHTLMVAMRQPQLDGIVLDINMPAGTGFGALAKLKASTKTAHIPVLVISATADPGVEASALNAGATAFLAKPVTPEGFLEAVERLKAA